MLASLHMQIGVSRSFSLFLSPSPPLFIRPVERALSSALFILDRHAVKISKLVMTHDGGDDLSMNAFLEGSNASKREWRPKRASFPCESNGNVCSLYGGIRLPLWREIPINAQNFMGHSIRMIHSTFAHTLLTKWEKARNKCSCFSCSWSQETAWDCFVFSPCDSKTKFTLFQIINQLEE